MDSVIPFYTPCCWLTYPSLTVDRDTLICLEATLTNWELTTEDSSHNSCHVFRSRCPRLRGNADTNGRWVRPSYKMRLFNRNHWTLESTGNDTWPNDVQLYQPYEVEQILINDNASCLAVQAFLRMTRLEFAVEMRANAEHMSPTGESETGLPNTQKATFWLTGSIVLFLLKRKTLLWWDFFCREAAIHTSKQLRHIRIGSHRQLCCQQGKDNLFNVLETKKCVRVKVDWC